MMKHAMLSAVTVLTAGLLGAAGPAVQGGSVTGTVKVTGTPPANPKLDMSDEAACRGKYTTDPVITASGGNLQNVLVYVKSGLPAGQKFTASTTPVVVDQEGCLYHPRTLAVMAGQPLEIRNSDPVLHNIKVVAKRNRGFNISQPTKGMKTTRTFTAQEIAIPGPGGPAPGRVQRARLDARESERVHASVLRGDGRRRLLHHQGLARRHVRGGGGAREARHPDHDGRRTRPGKRRRQLHLQSGELTSWAGRGCCRTAPPPSPPGLTSCTT